MFKVNCRNPWFRQISSKHLFFLLKNLITFVFEFETYKIQFLILIFNLTTEKCYQQKTIA